MTLPQLVGLTVVVSVGPTGRLSAQCPDGSPPPCRAARTAPAPVPNSVAVLYFDNVSPDTGDLFLAHGITEELIARLGQVPRLAVKSRAAVGRYRGVRGDPLAFGRSLGVAHLVDGSVRRAGGRLRITVELVRVANGDRVWGDSYERSATDLLAIEGEIARAVAIAIAGRLLPGEQASLMLHPTRNPAAYEHFLRGNYALARRTSQALADAIAYYETAARLDPSFDAAWSRAAYAYALASGYGYPGLGLDSLLSRGFVAVDHALRRDSGTADAWMALGLLRSFRDPRTRIGAREAYERAIALDPRNSEALHQYGALLWEMGLDSAAVAAYHRALVLEPERPITLTSLALVSLGGRRYGEAKRWSDSAVRADPAFAIAHAARFVIDWLTADTAGARADAMWLNAPAYLALLDLRAGDTLSARRRIAATLASSLQASDPLSVGEANNLGFILTASGQPQQALAVLERARPRGAVLWSWLRMPWWDSIRSHSSFQRLVEESRPQ